MKKSLLLNILLALMPFVLASFALFTPFASSVSAQNQTAQNPKPGRVAGEKPSVTRAPDAGVTVRQITRGPAHHYFGYIGQCRTIPWNASGRYILCLETQFQDRLPNPDDAASVCLIDTRDYSLRVVDYSRGWNPQQGTMFYWNPEHPETQFFFNDRDPKTGRIFTVLHDITAGPDGKGGRIREYRYDDCAVANGGVAQNGGYFLAINYARMARLRPVTGYNGAHDWTEGVAAPKDDGIHRIDVATGACTLIVSFEQLREVIRPIDPERVDTRHLFINHTLNNRNNDLIYFFCRADFEMEKEGSRINVPFTVRPDGSELTAHTFFIGGHPDWDMDNRMIGARGDNLVVCDVFTGKVVADLGGPELVINPGGDTAVSPAGRWLVNGSRVGKYNHYLFLDRRTGRSFKSPGVFMADWTTNGPRGAAVRLDPAPAWNRESNAIVVPGIAPDGTRQMFLITMPE
jgi:hypothetical protein